MKLLPIILLILSCSKPVLNVTAASVIPEPERPIFALGATFGDGVEAVPMKVWAPEVSPVSEKILAYKTVLRPSNPYDTVFIVDTVYCRDTVYVEKWAYAKQECKDDGVCWGGILVTVVVILFMGLLVFIGYAYKH